MGDDIELKLNIPVDVWQMMREKSGFRNYGELSTYMQEWCKNEFGLKQEQAERFVLEPWPFEKSRRVAATINRAYEEIVPRGER